MGGLQLLTQTYDIAAADAGLPGTLTSGWVELTLTQTKDIVNFIHIVIARIYIQLQLHTRYFNMWVG